jgi:hypothetical protein
MLLSNISLCSQCPLWFERMTTPSPGFLAVGGRTPAVIEIAVHSQAEQGK